MLKKIAQLYRKLTPEQSSTKLQQWQRQQNKQVGLNQIKWLLRSERKL